MYYNNIMIKPIVKWAGGKTQLLNDLLPLIPEFNRYYEPFFGGGALYFALAPQRAVINDYNDQLINLYKVVKKQPEELMEQLAALASQHSSEQYYLLRDEFNLSLKSNTKDLRTAAIFLYLNKAGYNGLYRLNKQGLFNVPDGKRKKVNLYDKENLIAASKALKHAKIKAGDFEKACQDAEAGDFVFFDSPYYNTFDTYKAGGFSEEDHKRLAALFYRLTQRGVKCLLTNSNEQFIKSLYERYDIKTIDVKRMINCDGKNRTGKEIIVKNY